MDPDYSIAKLSDFGEAKVKGLNTTRLRVSTIVGTTSRPEGPRTFIAGTAAYQAPEILLEELQETSRVAEMYSFGVLTWECLTRMIPHKGKKESSITVLAQKKSEPMLIVPTKPSKSLNKADFGAWKLMQQMASSCLSRDRSVRLTSTLVAAVWHRFERPKDIFQLGQTSRQILQPSQDRAGTLPTQPVTEEIYSPNKNHSAQSELVAEHSQQSVFSGHWKKLSGVAGVLGISLVVVVVLLVSGSDSNAKAANGDSTEVTSNHGATNVGGTTTTMLFLVLFGAGSLLF